MIAVFDCISHAFMHLPFNEGYLRMLRAAYPDAPIVFHARQAHIDQLAPRFAGDDRITFRACAPLATPFGLSRHNPLGGRIGAWQCWQSLQPSIRRQKLSFAALLGADSNLHAVFAARWPSASTAPLHMIIHNHVADVVNWRSRNPLIRMFDLLSVMRRPLPKRVRLVALELGIADAVKELAPAMAGAIETLEHPVLETEWLPDHGVAADGGPLRIGFVGHASVNKGFDRFVAWATRYAAPDREFHAVGIAGSETRTMDLSALARRPAARSEPRPEYLAALAACDVICLPLPPRSYEYVASGSVIDAIAGLKPLFSIRNRSFDAIGAKYGPIGHFAENADALGEVIGGLTRGGIAGERAAWMENLARLRAARRPEALAPAYAEAVARTAAG